MGIYTDNIWKPEWAWATFYTNESQTTTIEETSTPTQLNRATGLATAENIGLDLDGATGIITTQYSGLYYLNVSACFSGASGDIFSLNFKIAGSDVDEGKIQWTQNGGWHWEVSMANIYQINGEQEIDINITNLSDTTNISLVAFTQTIIKLH